jgi:hypothetical protein
VPAAGYVLYTLDVHDGIVGVGGDWDAFAVENGAPQLRAPAPIGRPFRDFVHGLELREALRLLFQSARRRGARCRLPFRCDAPDLRRHMEMDLEPGPEGELTIRCRALSLEARPRLPLPTPGAPRLEVACAWCLKMRLGSAWVEPEEALRANGLLEGAPFSLSHGICPPCAALFAEA